MKQKAYLVYRPVLNYEESEETLLITLTEDDAKHIVHEVQTHAEEFCMRLIPLDITMPDEQYDSGCEHNKEVMGSASWPYGIDYHFDLEQYPDGWSYRSGFIAYRELPLIAPPII